MDKDIWIFEALAVGRQTVHSLHTDMLGPRALFLFS